MVREFKPMRYQIRLNVVGICVVVVFGFSSFPALFIDSGYLSMGMARVCSMKEDTSNI